jgi:uncharacterized protein YceK
MRNVIIVLIIIVMIAGCSKVEITKISDSTYTDGLRFYRPDLYLIVTSDAGTTKTSVIALPNKNEEYVVRPVARIGTVDANATLTDGWNLTQLGAKVDTKVPEMIGALTGTLSAVVTTTEKRTIKETPLQPGLYRINFENGVVSGITKIPLSQ